MSLQSLSKFLIRSRFWGRCITHSKWVGGTGCKVQRLQWLQLKKKWLWIQVQIFCCSIYLYRDKLIFFLNCFFGISINVFNSQNAVVNIQCCDYASVHTYCWAACSSLLCSEIQEGEKNFDFSLLFLTTAVPFLGSYAETWGFIWGVWWQPCHWHPRGVKSWLELSPKVNRTPSKQLKGTSPSLSCRQESDFPVL